MASNLRVDQILPSTSTNVAIGTATGSVTLVGSVSGTSITNSGTTTVAAGSASAPSITPTGDSNTGIFFPSADTIAFAEGGVEALRIDSSANIGINSTSPGRKLDVVDSGDSGSVIRSRVTTNNGGYFAYEALNSSGTSVFSVTHNGRINLSENIVFASGQGLDFSATSNSSGTMTSELLSDYEEGTWTPSLNFSGGTTGITYTNRQGYYTKIGNIVYLQFVIVLSNKGSSTGNANVSGVPFGASITGYPNNAGVLVAENNLSSWQLGTYGLVWSDSSIYLRYNGTVNFTPLTETNFTNTSTIYFSTTYRV
jgi:hypothetical protein